MTLNFKELTDVQKELLDMGCAIEDSDAIDTEVETEAEVSVTTNIQETKEVQVEIEKAAEAGR